ncbi:MAG TPA: sigma-70 family RNA polymerase sigma factor [Xanthobacteraceae bacterium]|nr:sigma-70 family RNA polymerase sigma factor [Xanthobacteraceae bacterium]
MQISSKLQNASANRQTAVAAERTDEGLVQSIAAGDQFAMQLLFTRHRDKVNRFIQRFTRDESLTEDALSEVFLDVWRKAGSFKGECQVATWLLAIARNKTLALLRQRKFLALDETEAGLIEDPTDNPESALVKKSYSTLLQKCLNALSPNHRKIIDLVYYQSKSIQEAAEIVGIPLNTVKTRMFYARNQLGKVLKQAGVEHAYA